MLLGPYGEHQKSMRIRYHRIFGGLKKKKQKEIKKRNFYFENNELFPSNIRSAFVLHACNMCIIIVPKKTTTKKSKKKKK